MTEEPTKPINYRLYDIVGTLLQEGVIFTVKNYLNSEYDHDRLYASFFMTGISNNIDAKKQVSEYMSDGKYVILEVSFF